MRTLVVSDFHLGARRRHDVLQRTIPRERLLAATAAADRLVLLGDVLELSEGRPEHAIRIGEPILRELGERFPTDREIVFVPGNHDAALIRPWLRSARAELELDTAVPRDASPDLASMLQWLGPDRVDVRYPGVWLSPRVWATHGHYLDQHLIPTSSAGLPRGDLRRPPRDGAVPDEYERRAAEVDGAKIPAEGLSGRVAPLVATAIDFQARHASIPAFARTVLRLGVAADYVVFGHLHRLGSRTTWRGRPWRAPGGGPVPVNSGSWVYEPRIVEGARPPHAYWPGGAVVLEDGAAPAPCGLLDDLPADDLVLAR